MPQLWFAARAGGGRGDRRAQSGHDALLRPCRFHGHERGGRSRGRRRHCCAAITPPRASVIEAHGGAVEKFIGDAVVGVFGVPSVHEDDAERAVRAGLRIVQALDGHDPPGRLRSRGPRAASTRARLLVRLDVDSRRPARASSYR